MRGASAAAAALRAAAALSVAAALSERAHGEFPARALAAGANAPLPARARPVAGVGASFLPRANRVRAVQLGEPQGDRGGEVQFGSMCMWSLVLLASSMCCCFGGTIKSYLSGGYLGLALVFLGTIVYTIATTLLFFRFDLVWAWYEGKPIGIWCRVAYIFFAAQLGLSLCMWCVLLAMYFGRRAQEAERETIHRRTSAERAGEGLVGKPAPDFEIAFAGAAGKTKKRTLSSIVKRGKPVVISFYASF